RVLAAKTASDSAAAIAGFALACAALVRPVFAAYGALAIAGVELALRGRHPDTSGFLRRVAVFTGALLLSLVLIWAALYPHLSPATAFEAAILLPRRLFVGGGRFLSPSQIVHPGSLEVEVWTGSLIAGVIAASLASWIGAARRAGVRALFPFSAIVGFLGTMRLQKSPRPGFEVTILVAALLLLGLAAVFLMRKEIREIPWLAAGATFGLASIATSHYFWTRADAVHLAGPLAFAAAAAALAWRELGRGRKAVVASLFGILAVLSPQLPQYSIRLAMGGRQ